MWADILDLNDFYSSRLGRVTTRILRQKIRCFWAHAKNETLLGIGYTNPFLETFKEETKRTISLMPSRQGACFWPQNPGNLVILGDDECLPFADETFDKILLVHSLECTEKTKVFLREIWRVLGPSGRLLIIVPNRKGLWARMDRTPFSHGHPYSMNQLQQLLKENLLHPLRKKSALFLPPTFSHVLLSFANVWEKIGEKWFSMVGGVLMVEASKQIYGSTPVHSSLWRQRKKILKPITRCGKIPLTTLPPTRKKLF